jgi:hypothetical protein
MHYTGWQGLPENKRAISHQWCGPPGGSRSVVIPRGKHQSSGEPTKIPLLLRKQQSALEVKTMIRLTGFTAPLWHGNCVV